MKSEFRYEIIIYWSKDDNAFIAEIPELPGCAADGQTDLLATIAVGSHTLLVDDMRF